MTSLYLDASAITKLVVKEPETEALHARLRGRSLVSSRVVVVEVGKAVARANPTADPQPVLSKIAFVELDAELARLAVGTGQSGLRSLDAIHLASALRLGAEVAAFVTYDNRQAAAASDVGFLVESPT